jgi:hypothetical protein
LGTTVWQSKTALRISVCDHATDDADVAAAAQVVLRAVARNLKGAALSVGRSTLYRALRG